MKLNFSKRKICLILFSLFFFFGYGQHTKKNIILILGDDIGYKLLGCNGGTRYATPNLDSMAKQGMRFTQCHASPGCSPSRQALLSGKYNFRNYSLWGYYDTNKTNLTLANMLQDRGYRTGCFGKWQLGGGDAFIKSMGFERYCVFQPSYPELQKSRNSKYGNPDLYANGGFLPDSLTYGKYGDDIMTDSIKNFINENKNNPFFVYYPMILGHSPYSPTPDDSAYNTWYLTPKQSDTSFYPSMIKYMDKKIGQIVNEIKALGLQNNTILLFTGDNGSPNQILEITDLDSALGGKKSTTFSGTHVPLLVYGDGYVQPNVTNTDLIDFTDFFPTFADLAQTTMPTNAGNFDGKSFASRLNGQPGNPRDWIFNYYNPYVASGNVLRWAHTSSYKLYDSLGHYIFYNLANDINENNPLPNSILTVDEVLVKAKLQQVLDSFARESRPVLNNRLIRNITDTSVILGATITGIGGFPGVVERGSTYSTIQDAKPCAFFPNKLVEGGTSNSTFTQLRNHLKPQTQYSANCYATNNFGSGFSNQVIFQTLSKRVLSPCSTFNAVSGSASINLNWSPAVFPGRGATKARYLVVYSKNSVPAIVPFPNGTAPSEIIVTGSIFETPSTVLPNLPPTTATIQNIKPGTKVRFLLMPYTWDGKNATSYNYNFSNIKWDSAVAGYDFNVKAYPNPTTSSFVLQWESDSDEPVYLSYFDQLGTIVHQVMLHSKKRYSFGTSLPTGIYYIKFRQGINIRSIIVIKRDA